MTAASTAGRALSNRNFEGGLGSGLVLLVRGRRGREGEAGGCSLLLGNLGGLLGVGEG
jgi:hypothetical protein